MTTLVSSAAVSGAPSTASFDANVPSTRRFGMPLTVEVGLGPFSIGEICDYVKNRGSRDQPLGVSDRARSLMKAHEQEFVPQRPPNGSPVMSRQVVKFFVVETGLGPPYYIGDVALWAAARELGMFSPRTALQVAIRLCLRLQDLQYLHDVVIGMKPLASGRDLFLLKIVRVSSSPDAARLIDVQCAASATPCLRSYSFVYNPTLRAKP